MEILLHILLILICAKVFGEVIERAGFPSIVGEITAGVFLGSLLISPDNEILIFFAEIGAIFLLFTAGYKEVNLNDLQKAAKSALIPTVMQIFVTFSFGFLLGTIFNFNLLESIFIGVALSPTAIGVVVNTLVELNYLSSRPGPMMLTTSIFNDMIGIFMLSVVVEVATYNQLPSLMQLLLIAANIMAFLAIMAVIGLKTFPKAFEYIQKMHVRESIFAFVVAIALFSAYLAEAFELDAVIGAFVGGILLSRIPLAKIEDIQSKVSGFGYGIFIPIFFAFIGMSADLALIKTVGPFAVLLIVLALLGKLIGGFLGTKLIGFSGYDSLIFGVGIMPRGGIELVIISIGKNIGIIGDDVFSAIVVMVVASIIISPILLKMAVRLKERNLPEKSLGA